MIKYEEILKSSKVCVLPIEEKLQPIKSLRFSPVKISKSII